MDLFIPLTPILLGLGWLAWGLFYDKETNS